MSALRYTSSQLLRTLGLAVLLCTVGMLSACRTDLYSQLAEADANEMLTVLRNAGLEVDKAPADSGKGWRINVADEQVVQAMSLLSDHGLPRKPHANLGDLFHKDGMVSSPTEDKVRFLHGVSQELSETLTRIDGVVTARVHIVLPDNDPRNRSQTASSASVFIKHNPSINVASYLPSVRQLVARSVEGLDPERVAVTLVPAQVEFTRTAQPSESSSHWLWLVLAAAITAITVVGVLYARRRDEGLGQSGLSWPSLNAAAPQAAPSAEVA